MVNRPPNLQEIEACKPRIEQLTKDVQYDAIVYLGAVAKQFQTQLPSLVLLHPAKILREEYKYYYVREFALLLDRFIKEL